MVAVPETAVDHDGNSMLSENDVRLAGQINNIRDEANASTLEVRLDFKLSACSALLYGAHNGAALGATVDVQDGASVKAPSQACRSRGPDLGIAA